MVVNRSNIIHGGWSKFSSSNKVSWHTDAKKVIIEVCSRSPYHQHGWNNRSWWNYDVYIFCLYITPLFSRATQRSYLLPSKNVNQLKVLGDWCCPHLYFAGFTAKKVVQIFSANLNSSANNFFGEKYAFLYRSKVLIAGRYFQCVVYHFDNVCLCAGRYRNCGGTGRIWRMHTPLRLDVRKSG